MKTKAERNVILINSQFNGSYLESENHVGGEIINIYQSDDGEHYVYVCPYGNVGKEWKNRIKYVLFVRGVGDGLVKVIGKAEIDEDVETATFQKGSTIADCQKEYIEKNKITYGGVPLKELGSWSNNFVTFKAKSIFKAQKDIYLTTNKPKNNNFIQLSGVTRINNQSQKVYIDSKEEKNREDYEILLKEVIMKEEYWEKEKVGKVNINTDFEKETTFLSIIKKENSELVNSNLLAYLIENDSQYLFWKAIVNEIFHKKHNKNIDLQWRPEVLREHKNIDLLIKLYDKESNIKHVIVIENKIKSGINGIKRDEKKKITATQLGKYKETVNNEYKSVVDKSFYILRPNYNNEDISSLNKSWNEIKYSELENVIVDLLKNKKPKWNEIYSLAMNEFKVVVNKHSSEYDNELFEEVNRRFINSIKNKKSAK